MGTATLGSGPLASFLPHLDGSSLCAHRAASVVLSDERRTQRAALRMWVASDAQGGGLHFGRGEGPEARDGNDNAAHSNTDGTIKRGL